MEVNVNSIIRKYGEEKGLNLYNTRRIKQAVNISNRITSKSKKEIMFISRLQSLLTEELVLNKVIGWSSVDAFLKSENLIIEYNGTYWHGDPRKYQADSVLYKTMTVSKKNSIDAKRYEYQLRHNYRVAIIWESDDSIETVNKLIEFIKSNEKFFCSANNILSVRTKEEQFVNC